MATRPEAGQEETVAEKVLRILVAKPGLDGHDRGAKIIARALRDAGFEVIYTGLHQTPEMIAETAVQEDVDCVGLSILSGSHLELVPETVRLLRAAGISAPVVVGGIIPEPDQPVLLAAGVARVYTPKDFRVSEIVADLAELGLEHRRQNFSSTPGS